MKSMTGFGRGVGKTPYGSAEITLASINKRGLEIFVNLPRELSTLESELTELLKKSFDRGKLQLNVRLENDAPKTTTSIEARLAKLKALCKAQKVPFAPTTELLNSLLERSSSPAIDAKKILPSLKKILEQACEKCSTAQLAEGKRLKADFQKRLAKIEALASNAERLSGNTLALQRERLLKNLAGANLQIDLADERVLKELALYADRVDIAEELTRIRSHLKAAAELLAKNESIGRPLEFLLQEFLREWNTLGNKSPQVELIRLALEAKNEIERLREQAANIT